MLTSSGFPKWWNWRARRKAEGRMIVFDGPETMRFHRQEDLFDFYSRVRYADKEKKVSWDLPGHGESYVDCGKVRLLGCDNVESHVSGKVHGRLIKRSCRRKSCPTCFEGWASKEAEKTLIRLATFAVGFRSVQEVFHDVRSHFKGRPLREFHEALVFALEMLIKDGSKDRSKPSKVIHVVLSPPEGEISEYLPSFFRGRETVYRIAKESGFLGGCCKYHPYRLRCVKCKVSIPDHHKACPICGDSKFKWFWSPHFHVLGFGWIQKTKEGYLSHGWVVKNLGVRKSVFHTVLYLLSHAGVTFGVHSATWFGKLAYNKLRFVPKLGPLRELCPECFSVMFPLLFVKGDSDRGPPFEYSKISEENELLLDFSEYRVK